MSARALLALGIGQCVNWGVLYYAFAVLVLPLARELDVAAWVVTSAFSLALLTSALLAPAVGRWGDRDRGPWLMQAGGFTAAVLLVAWTFVPGVLALYVVWASLGVCMALTLYEPAFVVVGRAHRDPAARLRALAAVTLVGGLASTVFFPLTGLSVAAIGWRGAVLMLAAVLVASTWATRVAVFRHMPAVPNPPTVEHASGIVPDRGTSSQRFLIITLIFALASLAGAAFTTNLIPALGERGISPATAALSGGVIGVMQLPGRALLMNGVLGGSPAPLLALSLGLQSAGLVAVAWGPSLPAIAAGTMLFALGSGLTTLLRPHIIQTMYASERVGYLNGRIARSQQLARAAGPMVIAWLASQVGYAAVLTVIAGLFAAAILVCARSAIGGFALPRPARASTVEVVTSETANGKRTT
jgi:MFS family permease